MELRQRTLQALGDTGEARLEPLLVDRRRWRRVSRLRRAPATDPVFALAAQVCLAGFVEAGQCFRGLAVPGLAWIEKLRWLEVARLRLGLALEAQASVQVGILTVITARSEAI